MNRQPEEKLKKIKEIAKNLPPIQKYVDTITFSNQKHKKFKIYYKNRWIHFGDNRYEDFLDHKNPRRRQRYQIRAKRIRNKDRELTYVNPNYANYYAYHLLW